MSLFTHRPRFVCNAPMRTIHVFEGNLELERKKKRGRKREYKGMRGKWQSHKLFVSRTYLLAHTRISRVMEWMRTRECVGEEEKEGSSRIVWGTWAERQTLTDDWRINEEQCADADYGRYSLELHRQIGIPFNIYKLSHTYSTISNYLNTVDLNISINLQFVV